MGCGSDACALWASINRGIISLSTILANSAAFSAGCSWEAWALRERRESLGNSVTPDDSPPHLLMRSPSNEDGKLAIKSSILMERSFVYVSADKASNATKGFKKNPSFAVSFTNGKPDYF
jgi:hypothetical protein